MGDGWTGADLDALLDTLLPGNARYPSASMAGIAALAERRGRDAFGRRFWDEVFASTGPLDGRGRDGRIDAVRTFEAEAPARFAQLRQVAYIAYYEAPPVAAAIRERHPDYHTRLQPEGYRMAGFDPEDPLQRPTHSRGGYVPTDAVRRVARPALPDMPEDLEARA